MNKNYLIILLNYNNPQDTIECIQSLFKSDVDAKNILVIENCSADNSYERLQNEVPGILLLKMEKNLGFTGGNNVGIKYAADNKFDYAIVLNNDTIIESKDAISGLIDSMDKNKDVTIGTGRIFYYPEKDKIWYDGGKLLKLTGKAIHINFRKNVKDVQLVNEPRYIDFISGCFMCIRVSDIPRLGYMDEKIFIYLDDIDYSARAVGRNLKLKYFPQVVIYHKAKGEEKHTPKMAYYSLRNRKLVISNNFGFMSKVYFEMVLITKRIMYYFTNKKYYEILLQAVRDYNRQYFGQSPDIK